MSRGYYRNSLKAMRDELLKERRSLMSRYATMEKTGHPDRRDQGLLMDINLEMIGTVDRRMEELNASSVAMANS